MKSIIEFILSLFGGSKEAIKPSKKTQTKEEMDEILKTVLQEKSPEETIKEYQIEGMLTKEVMNPKTPDPITPVNFKTPRTQNEYVIHLPKHNMDLKNLIEDLNKYTNKTFKKKVILTMIDRTQAEQDYLYRNSTKYKKKKFKSPHQFWHAVDIRSFIFTRAEIKRIENYLNKKYNDKNFYRWTAKAHEVGNNGMHFHIQFVMKASLKKKGVKIK